MKVFEASGDLNRFEVKVEERAFEQELHISFGLKDAIFKSQKVLRKESGLGQVKITVEVV